MHLASVQSSRDIKSYKSDAHPSEALRSSCISEIAYPNSIPSSDVDNRMLLVESDWLIWPVITHDIGKSILATHCSPHIIRILTTEPRFNSTKTTTVKQRRTLESYNMGDRIRKILPFITVADDGELCECYIIFVINNRKAPQFPHYLGNL